VPGKFFSYNNYFVFIATGRQGRRLPKRVSDTTMDIADWRKKIDELDRQMVELLNQRASAAQEIGRLKRNTQMPIYEPEREKKIFENVRALNRGPLPNHELQHIFERIIDVMRALQKEEIQPKPAAPKGETEFDIEVND
jgi:chorismate mutase-like protein